MILWIKRHFGEEAFLHATLIEFVKCLGSGKRAHMFVEYVESIDCGTFESFSNLLGNPGIEHNLYFQQISDGGGPRGVRISLVSL